MTCNGRCYRIEQKRRGGVSPFLEGLWKCRVCEKFFKEEDVQTGEHGYRFCLCCRQRLSNVPRLMRLEAKIRYRAKKAARQ